MDKWFIDRVHPEPNSGCWLWVKYTNADGYGRVGKNGVSKRAHRVAYEMTHGPIPSGMVIMHKCDVRCCVNPDHLQLGTQIENIADATLKGRMSSPLKGKSWLGKKRSDRQKAMLAMARSRLSLEQVKSIKNDRRSNPVIAAEYGVATSAVQRIKTGKAFSKALELEGLF